MIGIILTIIFPGIGHLYFKKNVRGIIFILLSLIPFVYPIALIIAIIDCIRLNKTVPVEDRLSGREATVGIAIFFIVVPAAITILVVGFKVTGDYVSGRFIYPKSTHQKMQKIESELNKYYSYHHEYPGDLESFLSTKPIWSSWNKDSWKRKFKYEHKDPNTVVLTSAGRDGVFGTEDDITIVTN